MSEEFNPDEYEENFDFGFDFVDEVEVTEYETEIKSRVAEQGETVPSDLGEKIDKLIELRQGDESQMDILQKKYKEEMLKLEKMIMPLLYNLRKNPEDIYIKWPNRKEVIDKQIKKIVSITRGV